MADEYYKPWALSSVPYEPPHDKTNRMACAPSEDSVQPRHPPSLIRVFAVRIKKDWVLSYPLSAQRRLWSVWASLISLGGRPGWSESSLGAQMILFVSSWGGSYYLCQKLQQTYVNVEKKHKHANPSGPHSDCFSKILIRSIPCYFWQFVRN